MSTDNRQNNFDLIRLLAALQVLVVHGFEHLKLDMSKIWWLELFPGVPIFFVISGFLVSASYERSSSISSYAINRALRIYPGLWVCFILSLLSVLFIYEPIIVGSEATPWIIAQLTIGQFYNPDFLRGYGVGVLNGSLWTIPVEIQFYISIPLIYLILNKLNWKTSIAVVAFILLATINQFYQLFNQEDKTLLLKLVGVTAIPYLYLLILGILLQRNWENIHPLLHGKAGILIVIYLGTSLLLHKMGAPVYGNKMNPISATLLGLIAICLAYSAPTTAKKILRGNDISYGIYIYHMPLINILVHLNKTQSYSYFFLALVLTICISIISWVSIERPALSLKKIFISRKTAPLKASA